VIRPTRVDDTIDIVDLHHRYAGEVPQVLAERCSSHPRNCTYMCVQAPGGMQVFPDHSFDVVHVSQMILSVSDAAPGSD
jgi:hypothetical protein